MSDRLTHLEQYKMLREEIMQNSRALDTVQYAAALGAAAAYVWLVTNKAQVTLQLLWYIPPMLLLFCAAKSMDLSNRISQIARYLSRIEESAFGSDPHLPGWERYKTANRLRLYDRILIAATASVWLLACLGSLLLSWRLATSPH